MPKIQNLDEKDLIQQMADIDVRLESKNEDIKNLFLPLKGLRTKFKVYYMDLTDEAWEGRLDHVNPQRLARARELQKECLDLLEDRREIEEEFYRRAYEREAEQYHQESQASRHMRGPIR